MSSSGMPFSPLYLNFSLSSPPPAVCTRITHAHFLEQSYHQQSAPIGCPEWNTRLRLPSCGYWVVALVTWRWDLGCTRHPLIDVPVIHNQLTAHVTTKHTCSSRMHSRPLTTRQREGAS
jgi:hypothetical protein